MYINKSLFKQILKVRTDEHIILSEKTELMNPPPWPLPPRFEVGPQAQGPTRAVAVHVELLLGVEQAK